MYQNVLPYLIPNSDLLIRVQSLPLDEFGKKSALCDQLVIGSVLDDASALENEDSVAVPDRRKPVRDHNASSSTVIR